MTPTGQPPATTRGEQTASRPGKANGPFNFPKRPHIRVANFADLRFPTPNARELCEILLARSVIPWSPGCRPTPRPPRDHGDHHPYRRRSSDRRGLAGAGPRWESRGWNAMYVFELFFLFLEWDSTDVVHSSTLISVDERGLSPRQVNRVPKQGSPLTRVKLDVRETISKTAGERA